MGGLLLALFCASLPLALARVAGVTPGVGHPSRFYAQPGPVTGGLGTSVAISGEIAVVGAPAVNNLAGAAYVFVRARNRWGLRAVLTDPRNLPDDQFGSTVAASGSTALIGSVNATYVYAASGTHWHLQATLPTGTVALAGSIAAVSPLRTRDVQVYVRSRNHWRRQATLKVRQNLTPVGGNSIAISGTTVVIGIVSAVTGTGIASVFQRSGTRWQLRATLTDPHPMMYDSFGWSAAVSGSTILVGNLVGQVYVYAAAKSGWHLRTALLDPGGKITDTFGLAVALSGVTAVVSATGADSDSGAVYVYALIAGHWKRQATLTSPHRHEVNFGSAVAVAARTVVVGVPNSGLADAGVTYIYALSGARWVSQGALVDPHALPGADNGAAVAISGTSAVAGSWGREAAYIYGKSRGSWHQQVTVTDPGRNPSDLFGAAVGVSGSTAIVGAWGRTVRFGAAYIYVGSGGRWHRQATIPDQSSVLPTDFGAAVAISGSTAVIGAPLAGGTPQTGPTGVVYVFVRSGTGWHKQAMLSGSPAMMPANFGAAVALSGGTVVIGASGAHDDKGVAYVFARTGSRWRRQAVLPDPGGRPNDGFGTSVALSGATAVIGAPGAGGYAGTTYIYGRSGSRWRRQATLTIPRAVNVAGGFGAAVAISGTARNVIALVGGVSVAGLSTAKSQCGSVFEFTRPAGRWHEQARVADPHCRSYDEFGYALAISGRTALIGAPGTNGNTGTVYLITLVAPRSFAAVKLRFRHSSLSGLAIATRQAPLFLAQAHNDNTFRIGLSPRPTYRQTHRK